MSKMDIQDALERIKTATKESPLLLLTCGEKTNIICCFANTVMARQMIGQSNFIGIVDKTVRMSVNLPLRVQFPHYPNILSKPCHWAEDLKVCVRHFKHSHS